MYTLGVNFHIPCRVVKLLSLYCRLDSIYRLPSYHKRLLGFLYFRADKVTVFALRNSTFSLTCKITTAWGT